MRHYPLLSFAIAGLTTLSASASSYVSDFTGLNPGDSLAGFDGWTQSHPNESGLEDIDGVETLVQYPWAFGSSINGNPAAAVGGYFNTDPPAGDVFYASHTLSLDGLMDFQMNFTVVDSDPFDIDGVLYGSARNQFSVGFHNTIGAEVFSLVFDPNTDLENPDPLLNAFDTWNVSSSSGGIKTTATMAIIEGGLYSLQLSLVPNAGNLNFSYSLTSSVNTQSANGVVAGLSNAEFTEMRIGIAAADNEFGTNFLAFEGVGAAIPEPSSLLLFSFTFGGLALLRKRR